MVTYIEWVGEMGGNARREDGSDKMPSISPLMSIKLHVLLITGKH